MRDNVIQRPKDNFNNISQNSILRVKEKLKFYLTSSLEKQKYSKTSLIKEKKILMGKKIKSKNLLPALNMYIDFLDHS